MDAHNAEIQPRWGQLLEILRFRKEVKYLIELPWNQLLSPEDEWSY